MSTINKTFERMNGKALLSTLWIFAISNYLYCDFMGLMESKTLNGILTGETNGIHITQGFLLGSSVLMEIPIAMILLSRVLPFRPNRWLNIIAGTAMTIVQIGSLFIGKPTAYYVFYSALEIAATSFIVFYAWKMKTVKTVEMKPLTSESQWSGRSRQDA